MDSFTARKVYDNYRVLYLILACAYALRGVIVVGLWCVHAFVCPSVGPSFLDRRSELET